MTHLIRAFVSLASCAMAMGIAGGAVPVGTQVRVYVYTAQAKGGVVPEDEQGRVDSVRDVREALRRSIRIVLVSEAGEAQALVEVVGREKRETAGGGFGGTVLTPPVETIVRLRVTFGTHETEIKGVGQVYWARAAKDAAERLVKWIARVSATP